MISVLLVAAVTVVLWMAYREVEDVLIRAGREHAAGAAQQVANLVQQAALSSAANLRRVAADEAVRDYLQRPTARTRRVVQARLATLATTATRRIELWSTSGRVLDVSPRGTTRGDAAMLTVPVIAQPPELGFGGLQASGDVLFNDAAAEVLAGSETPAIVGARLGYVITRSAVTASASTMLGALIGEGATLIIGNPATGTWTDLSQLVAAPPVDMTRNGTVEYRTATGEWRLGGATALRTTPWSVWVEFPRSVSTAPAGIFLRRMVRLVLVVVVAGLILVATVSVRTTIPLEHLARAADAMAAGDYAQHVHMTRADEIGRLGRAFNAMAAEVRDTHQQLVARVRERTTALEALQASDARCRTIVDMALDPIITMDGDGRIVEFNPAAETTFGYTKAAVVGGALAHLIVPPRLHAVHGAALVPARGASLGRALGQRFEMTARRADGTELLIELALSTVSREDVVLTTAVVRDLTARQYLEATRVRIHDMEAQQARTLEANRLKSEFLANMSHELRTPLNAIIGFSELMHRGKVGPVSPDHQEFLGDILSSAKHLLQLINDVLDLAKVESGKMEFRPEPVDLTRLAQEVRQAVRGLADAQGIQIDVEVDATVVAVVIDPARLKQVLYNYLSNGIKFTPAGGTVAVRIGPEGSDQFRIDVADTGVGIAAMDLEKLFVEFQQLDTSSTKTHQGTGLGLALIKRLVEAQGGRVAVRSTLGEGSTFSAVLPRQMTGDAPTVPARAADQPATGRTIVVLDDDAATLKLACVALREWGYEPVCTTNAIEALLAAEADPPAAVVVDLLMPHVDGFEFIAKLRALPVGKDVPILVWSVKDLNPDDRRWLNAATVTYASKTNGGTQALIETLRQVLTAPFGGATGARPDAREVA
jgi:PAS domain S-box-containing protein